MRQNALVLAALIALLGGCATARGTAAPANTAVLEHVLNDWAVAWSTGDVEKLLPLFTDDVYYEDVTFAAINTGQSALHDFAKAAFGAFPDMSFEVKSRFVAANGKMGGH